MSKSVTRVRVEINPKDDPEVRLRRLLTALSSACKAYGIPKSYKQHQAYESKSRKKRRKKRESEIARMKNKLKDNFLQQGK